MNERMKRGFFLLAALWILPVQAAPDQWDPLDDTAAGATLLTVSTSVGQHGTHFLDASDQYDCFKINMIAGNRYTFESTGDSDTYAELFNSTTLDTANRVFWNDDDGAGANFRLNYTPVISGYHYLRVRHYTVGSAATYMLFHSYVLPKPDLVPYQPSLWDSKLVISTVTGTTTSAPSFLTTDTLYLDLAVVNVGSVQIPGPFALCSLYVDNVFIVKFTNTGGLLGGYYSYILDRNLGSLSAGMHTIKIVADPDGVVDEEDETNNEFTRTITVLEAKPDLVPYQPSLWDSKLVISTVTGTTTSASSFFTTDTLYIDYSVLNDSSIEIPGPFALCSIYVDNVFIVKRTNTVNLLGGYHAYSKDHNLGSLSAGTHTIKIVVDPDGVVDELNEANNEFIRTITVLEAQAAAPANVAATDGTFSDKVRVTWSAVSGASHYCVYRATSSGGTKTTLTPTWQTDTTFDDTTTVGGPTYYYWVKAGTSSNGASASDFSAYDTGSRPVDPVTVNNLAFSQRPGTKLVDITYDLSSLAAPSVIVALAVKNGSTPLSTASATGHIGTDVTVAPGKAIVWNMAADWNGQLSSNIAITVSASIASRIIRLSGDLAFGNVQAGANEMRTLTIHNDGNSPLAVSGISFPSGFSGNWSGVVTAGGSNTVPVTFSPAAATNYGGTVTVNSDKTEGTHTWACSGQGIPADYMVIDFSGGTNAASYPVTYLTAVPSGGWTDEYKTTKLVMHKIPAGSFTMGSPTNELGRSMYDNETQHAVTLTKDFYIGVFEVTQRQWELVMGNKPSYFTNATYYASRPVDQVSYYDIRENPANTPINPHWPASAQVHAASFMGKLRSKAGLSTFDLPTESQWEYACRAGTTTALNSGNNLTSTSNDPQLSEVGRYWWNGGSGYAQNGDTSVGSAKVGAYLPNAWGLYDMHGNVREWCLDRFGTYPGTASDPLGDLLMGNRVDRGGAWRMNASSCRSAYRGSIANDNTQRNYSIGFRTAMTLP